MVICWLKICLVLLAVASILSEIELKGGRSSACSGHLFAKNLFGSACSGQYFMSKIELKRISKVLLAVVICWLKICSVLLAMASILCLR